MFIIFKFTEVKITKKKNPELQQHFLKFIIWSDSEVLIVSHC